MLQARRRREQVRQLLVLGLNYEQIAAKLGMKQSAVREDTFVLCRQHGVKGRRELIAKWQAEAAWSMASK
jgi:DNA-binding NarL/FixJ family response regulator